jgi:hypothetical protein
MDRETRKEISEWSNEISKMETIYRNLEKLLATPYSVRGFGDWRRSIAAAATELSQGISYQKRLLAENLPQRRIQLDQDGLDKMAKKAANSKSGRSKDGPCVVTVILPTT